MQTPGISASAETARRRRATARTTIALMVMLGALALVACGGDDEGGTGATADGQLESVDVSLYARDNPFLNSIAEGAQYAGEELGVDVNVSYGENDPTQQVSQIENIITTQPGGLIVAPIDREAIAPVVQSASDAGIEVVTVADDLGEDSRDARLFYAGTQYVQTGRDKAQFIVDALGGKGKVAVIHLIRGLSFTEEQWDGAMEVFAENPGIEIVGEEYAGGAESNLGLEAAENFLTANPDLDALYVDNDDLALGAIRAAEQRGIDMDEIVIIGANGTPTAIEAVKAGELDLTVAFCGFAQGERAVNALAEFIESGTEPPDPLDSINVTQENIEEVEPELGPGCTEPAE